MKALEKQKPNDEQQDSDDEKIKFATSLAPNRFARIDIFRALDSFWREFKRPGKNHRHGKSDNEQQHYKTHCPIRNFEERKDLTRDLHQQPCDDCVGDRDLVNVAPLQFAEEILRIHCSFLCHTAPSPSSRSAAASETCRSRGVKVNPTFENQKAKPTIEISAAHQDIRLQSKFTAEQLPAMPGDVEKLHSKIERAVADGQLMESAATNIRTLLSRAPSDFYLRVIDELVTADAWPELNDRFYQALVFGTGGLRGRTIGRIVTTAERGNSPENERPQFPCVGTNAMNSFNISRSTQGLVAYLQDFVGSTESRPTRPKIVITHDPRFFSNEFTELAAKVASENGCDACVFDGPRSVPELSFAVRHLKANAGVVITASHNPPYD